MKCYSIPAFAILLYGSFMLLSPSISCGQISPISRLSSVDARETLETLLGDTGVIEQNELTSDFFPFDQQVSAGNATARQTTFFGLQSVEVSTFADAGLAGTEFGSTLASSLFRVTFAIDSPTEFHLVGSMLENDSLEPFGFDKGGSSISLTSDVSTIEFKSDFENTVLLDETGVLAPNTYTLEFRSSGSENTIEPSAVTSIDATITFSAAVPEPAHASLLALASLVSCLRRKK